MNTVASFQQFSQQNQEQDSHKWWGGHDNSSTIPSLSDNSQEKLGEKGSPIKSSCQV